MANPLPAARLVRGTTAALTQACVQAAAASSVQGPQQAQRITCPQAHVFGTGIKSGQGDLRDLVMSGPGERFVKKHQRSGCESWPKSQETKESVTP